MVQIDTDLVMRCVRNLHFYGCLTLIPLFMYANTYVATEQLHNFYTNADLIEVSIFLIFCFSYSLGYIEFSFHFMN